MKGKIPVAGFVELENTGEDQWRLFSNGVLGKNFEITGTIIQNQNSQEKARLRIFIDQIVPPESQFFRINSRFDTNLKGFSLGLSRIDDSLANYIYDSAWILLGRVNGKEESPIIICYFPKVKKSLYSLKLVGEDKENFLPHNLN